MFSRFREVIENTLVEEQARHRAAQPQRQESNATASRAARKPAQGEGTINPADFEVVFAVDDGDGDPASRAATPQLAAPTAASTTDTAAMSSPDADTKSSAAPSRNGDGAAAAASPATASVSPEVQAKLDKLDKIDGGYQKLLRCYKTAYARCKKLDEFETVLREHTPLTNTRDSAAFVKYLEETRSQKNMLNEEIKRLMGKSEDFQKLAEEQAQGLKRVSQRLVEAERELKERLTSNEETHQAALNHLDKLKTSTEVNDALKEKLTKSESECQRLKEDLEKALKQAKPADEEADVSETLHPESANTRATKKKNKKKNKNKKGGAPTAESVASAAPPSELSEGPPPHPLDNTALEGYEAEVEKLKDLLVEKNAYIDELLERQRATQTGELKKKLAQKVEKIDSLEELYRSEAESLVDTRKDLAEARKKNQELSTQKVQLETDKADLEVRIDALQKQASSGPDHQEKNARLQKGLESRMGELKELNEKVQALETENQSLKSTIQTLESDLGASQDLAQERYKEITRRGDLFSKLQTEHKSLRQDAESLRSTKEQLAAKEKDILAASRQEKESYLQIKRLQTLLAESEAGAKALRDQLNGEKQTVANLQKDLNNAKRDRDHESAKIVEISGRNNELVRKLETLEEQVSTLRAKTDMLEQDNTQLRKDKNVAEERAEFKNKQVKSGEDLVASMRDQARELGVQLKEAQALADSLAEELEDAKKHLNERTRDAESMRRLLAEENSRVDGQIQEIQSRLDAAIDERDRAEEELSREGRRRTREIEELKVRVRELEREVKTLSSQNDELEQREKDWAQRRQNLEQIEQKAAADDEEMRTTIFNLQNALDKSEQEVRGAEKRCVELRKLLDDTRTRFEKLKTQQQQQQQQQSRSSIDSNRTQNGSGPSVDVAYLKAVLLQFLELKGEMRPQMIPVLGKLLGFTADDNDKWMKVTQQLSTKSGR